MSDDDQKTEETKKPAPTKVLVPRPNPIKLEASDTSKATANLQKEFTLEGFFAGEIIGRGSFFSKLAGIGRDFRTTAFGTWDGDVLTIVETYEYAATKAETRLWRFTKSGANTYVGESDEIVGKAKVRIRGKVAKLRYRKNIELPDRDKPTRVTHVETWTLKENGVLESRTQLRKGVRIGREAINFVRSDNEDALSAP